MRVAYLILAHNKPEHLIRLVGQLPEQSPVFIHYDRRSPAADVAKLEDAFAGRDQIRLVRRHACRWGNFGIVAATLELLHAALESGAQFDYASLISGADYPIKSHRAFAAMLAERSGTEFIESFDFAKPNRWSDHGGNYSPEMRYHRYYFWFRSRAIPLFRRSVKRLPALHGGSQWWTLSRGCIEFIARYLAENPGYTRFFRNSFIPDECFFQTLVAASPYADKILGEDLVFTIWDRPEPPYPAILRCSDLETLRGTGKFFARKFDYATDSKVLDLIDSELLS